ncbi:DegV family protein [Alkalihalobacillus sp. LMS39]|uniref:DegV family protein n=1 Tax=Alkalihalobacillus sp. LMS39 TaxID=2924032 RepID=UPI001FB3EAA1|nr:DegV family protein [Alkalihalobacillus sp. LMS39]UOE93814.1 DegV family protein [Alkalihalobacillus sp. LMS39]
MSKIAVITDSTAYLPQQVIDELDIHVVPLNVVIGEESYQEGVDMTTNEFYAMMKAEDKFPKTSQPAIGLFVNLFEQLKTEGYDEVISIHLSSGISGTFQTAVSAKGMVEGINVHVFDSEISCSPQGFFVMEAAALAKEGKPATAILERLEEMKTTGKAYFVVDDLNHLHRGGRLNAAQLVVGSLLKIKPILHFVEGKIVPFEKVRTAKKALGKIYTMLDEDVSNGSWQISVIHANCEEKGQEIVNELQEKYPNAKVSLSYFGPVIGTHLGEGSIGIGWNTVK